MKTPAPRLLPSGHYTLQLRLGGESISITRETASECTREAELLKAKYRNGLQNGVKSVQNQTLDTLMTNYITSRRKVLSPSTIAGYQVIRKNRFQPYINKTPAQIKTSWQKLIDAEVEAGISAKTIRNAWGLLSSALDHAGIAPPQVALPPVIRSTREWLDADQIKTFIKAMHGNEYEIPALLALHSLRRSEIFGLTWEKIDLKQNLIHVEGSVVQDENSKQIYKETNKTKNSRRTIPIMIPRLKELLNAVPKAKRKGKIYTAPQNYLWREINSVCEANGLPAVGVHGLRHSFASLAVFVGLSPREAMDIGGWDDIGTMTKIYAHISTANRLKNENKIAQFFAGDQG